MFDKAAITSDVMETLSTILELTRNTGDLQFKMVLVYAFLV